MAEGATNEIGMGDLSTMSQGSKSFRAFTAREKGILLLAAHGYTNVQIAVQLNISKYTVAQHIAKMLRRTGAANRTDLVHRAHIAGVIAD